MSHVRIEESWKRALANEFERPYFQTIATFLKTELSAGKTIYPPGPLIFNAFDTTPFDKVKVVILGQDPYHNPNEAMGLSFSVPKSVRVPPSLKNIYKEINADLGLPIPPHGDLTPWAKQGVFLLNAMLTVGTVAASHQQIGWQFFTDAVIQKLSAERQDLVFMLWGSYAQKKGEVIDGKKHLVLKSPHPSPLSAHRGFFKCRHFSKANAYLKAQGVPRVDWSIS